MHNVNIMQNNMTKKERLNRFLEDNLTNLKQILKLKSDYSKFYSDFRLILR